MDLAIAIIDTSPLKGFAKLAIESTLASVAAKRVVCFSDAAFFPGADFVQINPIRSIRQYSEFVLSGLPHFISEDRLLLIQWDGFAVHRSSWKPEFLEYDYIGAPWPDVPEPRSVGNGGFSLRSKHLLESIAALGIHTSETIAKGDLEDVLICQTFGHQLEMAGVKFAPPSIACDFSFETGSLPTPSFGFHGSFNFPFYFSEDFLVANVDELLSRVRNPRALALFVFNAFRVGYHSSIDSVLRGIWHSRPELVEQIQQAFTAAGIRLPLPLLNS